MENHRVSVSLVIDDDKLYNSFILPNKHQRTLNNIIIKCLTAYFYDEDIRKAILGSMANVVKIKEDNKDLQSKFDSIKSTLLMQDFYAQQMSSLLEEGQELTEDMLRSANNRAAQQGNYETQKTTSGSQMLLPTSDMPSLPAQATDLASLNAKVDTLFQMLGGMIQSSSGVPMVGMPMLPQVQNQALLQQMMAQLQSTMPQETTENVEPKKEDKKPKVEVKVEEKVEPKVEKVTTTEQPTTEKDTSFDGFEETTETEKGDNQADEALAKALKDAWF